MGMGGPDAVFGAALGKAIWRSAGKEIGREVGQSIARSIPRAWSAAVYGGGAAGMLYDINRRQAARRQGAVEVDQREVDKPEE